MLYITHFLAVALFVCSLTYIVVKKTVYDHDLERKSIVSAILFFCSFLLGLMAGRFAPDNAMRPLNRAGLLWLSCIPAIFLIVMVFAIIAKMFSKNTREIRVFSLKPSDYRVYTNLEWVKGLNVLNIAMPLKEILECAEGRIVFNLDPPKNGREIVVKCIKLTEGVYMCMDYSYMDHRKILTIRNLVICVTAIAAVTLPIMLNIADAEYVRTGTNILRTSDVNPISGIVTIVCGGTFIAFFGQKNLMKYFGCFLMIVGIVCLIACVL